MSEALYTMANTKIFIGDAPMQSKIEITPNDFADVSWMEITGLYNVGELGGEQTINEFELINSNWFFKTKGSRNGGTMTNQFIPLALDPGQKKVLDAIEDNCGVYPVRVERGADCSPESVVTISDDDPAVVTWAGHGLLDGQPVMFSVEGGDLPDEIQDGVVYYVIDPQSNTFNISAEPGGSAISVASEGTGTITATAPPAGMTDMFQALVTDGARSGGAKNDLYLRTWNFAVNGRIITV